MERGDAGIGKARIGRTCGRGLFSGGRRAVGRFVSTEHGEPRCSFGFNFCTKNRTKE